MVRYGTLRYATVRYGTLRYATVRYGIEDKFGSPTVFLGRGILSGIRILGMKKVLGDKSIFSEDKRIRVN
jgi:hypothetical protein